MKTNATPDRDWRECCFDNHQAARVGVYEPFEVWVNARTGQAEVFVRAEHFEQAPVPAGLPAEVEAMLASAGGLASAGRLEPVAGRRERWPRVLGTIILVTWLILACTTTALLAALMVLRLS